MNVRRSLLAIALAAAPGIALAAPSTAVKVQTAHLRTLSDTVTAYGQLIPAPGKLQWLSAAQGGRIAAILVSRGARVKKGQALVRIAATPQTQAALQSARSSLASARAKLKQTRTLEKSGLATRSDLASARGAFETAKARLAALETEGSGAHAHTLKAAFAGVVTRLPVARGDWVNPGGHVAALSPADALWVRFGLTPRQAAAVRHRAKVSIKPVFGNGRTLPSHVAQVDAQADTATGLIDAEVPVKAGSKGPFVGEWVRGTITLHHVKAVAVKRSAVLKDAKGFYVFVIDHGIAHRVGVTPLIRTEGLVGLKGLAPGASVVTQGNFELHDGDHVRIEKARGPAS